MPNTEIQSGWQLSPYSEGSGRIGVTMTYFDHGVNRGELGAWQEEDRSWKIDALGPTKTVIFSVRTGVLAAIEEALMAVGLPPLLPEKEEAVRRLLAA